MPIFGSWRHSGFVSPPAYSANTVGNSSSAGNDDGIRLRGGADSMARIGTMAATESLGHTTRTPTPIPTVRRRESVGDTATPNESTGRLRREKADERRDTGVPLRRAHSLLDVSMQPLSALRPYVPVPTTAIESAAPEARLRAFSTMVKAGPFPELFKSAILRMIAVILEITTFVEQAGRNMKDAKVLVLYIATVAERTLRPLDPSHYSPALKGGIDQFTAVLIPITEDITALASSRPFPKWIINYYDRDASKLAAWKQSIADAIVDIQLEATIASAANSTFKYRPRQQSTEQHPQQDVEQLNKALAGLGDYRIPREHLEIDESSVVGKGGFGVVIRGRLFGYNSEVAIKRLQSDETQDIRVAKRLIREMKAWSKLNHRNILPLIGFYLSGGLDEALIVCPLQPHGNIKDYLQLVKPKLGVLERLELAFDTLCAVEYLHNLDPPVVHGDIKAVNILLNDERRAVLCDFGLAVAADEVQTGLNTSKGLKGTMRYCSPELVMQEESLRTVSSDIWAWGCLLVEIMKETIPYSKLKNEFQVMFALTNRVPPESEQLLTHPIDIWSTVRDCWQFDPELRPRAGTPAKDLRRLVRRSISSSAFMS
ncbi:hypothetical protein FRB95_013440 [Tulasnella sp. JGI-2019a]|nr:hypothetical protein FRB95_013440 [Tulasnella sp. JGI-2019a]